MREREIEAYLVNLVEAMGGEVRKVRWIGRRGAPDRLVLLPHLPAVVLKGRKVDAFPSLALWVELKAPGKKPTAQQQREHERLRQCGQRVEVIDSLERVNEVVL